MTTTAQDEFDELVAKSATTGDSRHPQDRDDQHAGPNPDDDLTEEDHFRHSQIHAAMRMTTGPSELKLPPASFDSGRTTGVKGVIADARSYENARRSKWRSRMQNARQSIFRFDSALGAGSTMTTITGGRKSASDTESDAQSGSDVAPSEESFLQQWREARRKELETGASRAVRNRRTSPSVRVYGRLEAVDALGYLDAIEKVNRDTVVVVFVYDDGSEICEQVEEALLPVVQTNDTVRFVKIHAHDIEFDNAAVPALLAYRNQGDLFANLTGLVDYFADDETVSSQSLRNVLKSHGVLS